MAYFGGACALTKFTAFALANSKYGKVHVKHSFGFSLVSLALMWGTMNLSYDDNWYLKNLTYGLMNGSLGVTIVPFINLIKMKILTDVLLGTGVIMGSLGILAYNAPSDQFLK